ncbi:MAG: hypothetical protein LBU89_13130 [Fibromonadaceae bacterium]|jgi:hypothetical protein|nr:hypothetical protein [Fibromonadaceae bacterium]
MEKKKSKLIDIVKAGALSVALTLGACATQEEDEDVNDIPEISEATGLSCEDLKEIESLSLNENFVETCKLLNEYNYLVGNTTIKDLPVEVTNICADTYGKVWNPMLESGERDRNDLSANLGGIRKTVRCYWNVFDSGLRLKDANEKCENGSESLEDYKSEYLKQKQECLGM